MKYATRILVCVIAVSKSQEFLLKVRRRFIFFRRRRKGFDFDDESMFFRRRRTLGPVHKCLHKAKLHYASWFKAVSKLVGD